MSSEAKQWKVQMPGFSALPVSLARDTAGRCLVHVFCVGSLTAVSGTGLDPVIHELYLP
jgi:hypothetical protein